MRTRLGLFGIPEDGDSLQETGTSPRSTSPTGPILTGSFTSGAETSCVLVSDFLSALLNQRFFSVRRVPVPQLSPTAAERSNSYLDYADRRIRQLDSIASRRGQGLIGKGEHRAVTCLKRSYCAQQL